MARSSVFDADTVIASSDCTGTLPICARAFMTGAAWASCCGAAGLRFDCFCFFSDARVMASGSADWVNAAVDDINANENADAPKTKARECQAPKAILPNLLFCLLGLAGGRALKMQAASWLPTVATEPPQPVSH